MHFESIKETLHKVPFEPFTVRTVSGGVFLVDHPENAWFTRGGRTMFVSLPGGAGERFQMIDTALIERVEPGGEVLP